MPIMDRDRAIQFIAALDAEAERRGITRLQVLAEQIDALIKQTAEKPKDDPNA